MYPHLATSFTVSVSAIRPPRRFSYLSYQLLGYCEKASIILKISEDWVKTDAINLLLQQALNVKNRKFIIIHILPLLDITYTCWHYTKKIIKFVYKLSKTTHRELLFYNRNSMRLTDSNKLLETVSNTYYFSC